MEKSGFHSAARIIFLPMSWRKNILKAAVINMLLGAGHFLPWKIRLKSFWKYCRCTNRSSCSKMKPFLILCLIAGLLFVSCQRKYPEEKNTEAVDKEHMLDVNRTVVHDEAKAIEEFISRHGWKMQMTGTGLHYQIY